MKQANLKNILWNYSKNLANLNFSILILFLICFCIMLGSIIEQDQNIEYYKAYYPVNNFNLFEFNWKLIFFLGLNHLYQAWWFILILFIFSYSLIICTFSIQLPSLKNARRWKFFSLANNLYSSNQITNSINHSKNSFINFIYSLEYYNFYVFHKKDSIYAYKGIIGRISPVFVHFSIVMILIGSIYSVIFGCVVQEVIPSGEIFHLKNIVSSGFYSNFNSNIFGKIDDFTIDYNLDDSINQFFSKISLLNNNGDIVISKVVSVNNPLYFSNLTFYQTNWDMNLVRLKIGYRKPFLFQFKLIKTKIGNRNCWLVKLPFNNNSILYILILDLKNSLLLVNSNGFIIGHVNINENFYINETLICVKSIVLNTGLQIKLDPGIHIVYFGFFILMLTTILSYISYSQIWVYKTYHFFNLLGTTNRAIFFFEEDFMQINTMYYYYTFKFILFKVIF